MWRRSGRYFSDALDILFLHPNFPGQFGRLAQALHAQCGYRVVSLSDEGWSATHARPAGVEALYYPTVDDTPHPIHPWAKGFEQAIRRAEAAATVLAGVKRQGFEPDVIIAHPGWGDAFFVRDLFPGARTIGFFEYYYSARGADMGFDPEFPNPLEGMFRSHARNATQLLALESCELGVCPTEWQRSRFPPAYRDRLQVIHEGIDTELVAPDPAARVTLPDGRTLGRDDEVLTFVSRSLEPYRGIHSFLRMLAVLLPQRPALQVLVVGDTEGTSYGNPPAGGGTWRDTLLQELDGRLDRSRVHFLGRLPYADYLRVLQVSRLHVYLTYPFVLSWSLLEALSAGCLVVASDTAPVREVIAHEHNGLLTDFFDIDGMAAVVDEALDAGVALDPLRRAARDTIVQAYDFRRHALPGYLNLIND